MMWWVILQSLPKNRNKDKEYRPKFSAQLNIKEGPLKILARL